MFKELSTLGFSLFTFWSLHLLSPFPTACAAPAPGGFSPNIYDVTSKPDYAYTNSGSRQGQTATVASVWGDKPYHLFRSWMTDFYPAIIPRHDKNKYFKDGDFTRYLGRNLAVDGEEKVGRYNVGVFEYKDTSNSNNLDMVIKVLSHSGLDDGVYGEAKTLDLMGLYDKSGFVFCNTARSVKDPQTGKIEKVYQYSKYPAILMRRVGGVPITETPQWENENGGGRTKNQMMAVVKSLVKTQVMSIWAEHGFIYMDLNMDNVHISFDPQGDISTARLFDFGYPGAVAVKSGTTQAEIEELFEQCWKIFWPSYR